MTALALSPQEIIITHGRELRTDSRKVADVFGKLHKNIIQRIETLDCSPEFTSANFSAHVENQIVGTAKRDLKFYEMTKDGFMFLVMGFTGKRAAQIKEAYINAFNWMADQLLGAKTTTDDRTPLRDAVNMLVGKKGLMYPEAYNMVHQRFAVEHIDQLKPDQIPQAVEYVHRLVLEGEVLLPEPTKPAMDDDLLEHIRILCSKAEWIRGWWERFGPSLKVLNPRLAASVHDHIVTAAAMSRSVVRQTGVSGADRRYIANYPWLEDYEVRNQYRQGLL